MVESAYWTGGSGKTYDYGVYLISFNFDPNQYGNYIYCKRGLGGNWIPIYIGEGDLQDRSNVESHHQGECIKRKGATHLHAHLNDNKKAGKAEEQDLLVGYPQAFKPIGCNEKEGG